MVSPMRKIITLITLLLFSAQMSVAAESPQDFFQRFDQLGQRFDPSVADLYSDGASIKIYRRYPTGLERSMEMAGTEWKALVRKVMPAASAKNDKSTFTNVRYSALTATKVKINADRYAVRKCYTDPAYYLVIEMQPNGRYSIVEEHFETKPLSDC